MLIVWAASGQSQPTVTLICPVPSLVERLVERLVRWSDNLYYNKGGKFHVLWVLEKQIFFLSSLYYRLPLTTLQHTARGL